jgi:hypothetical protein
LRGFTSHVGVSKSIFLSATNIEKPSTTNQNIVHWKKQAENAFMKVSKTSNSPEKDVIFFKGSK